MDFKSGLLVITFWIVSVVCDGEKREMPNQFAYSVYRTGDTTSVLGNQNGMYSSMSSAVGTGGSSSTMTERQSQLPPFNVAVGPAAPSTGTYGGGPYGNGAGGPPYSPYGFKDPGFSVQTGFEGFLVPNPWYGAISWGIEGLIIAGIAIVFVLGLKAGLIFLLFKFFRIGKLFKDDDGTESGDTSGSRSYIPSVFNMNNLHRLTTNVLDAIDNYNALILEDKS